MRRLHLNEVTECYEGEHLEIVVSVPVGVYNKKVEELVKRYTTIEHDEEASRQLATNEVDDCMRWLFTPYCQIKE